MTDQPLSKLRLEFDRSATEQNRQPDLKGKYSLAPDAPEITAAFWTGAAATTGQLHARGKLTFASISAAVEAKAAAKTNPPQLPRGVDLNVGEAVIFRTNETGKNGAVHWYGYAHEGAQIVRIDAYENGASFMLGSARAWRPKSAAAAPQGDAPEVA